MKNRKFLWNNKSYNHLSLREVKIQTCKGCIQWVSNDEKKGVFVLSVEGFYSDLQREGRGGTN